jgi:hypothetical protein
LAVSAGVITVAGVAFGPLGATLAFFAGLLGTAWYGDDDLGTCLPLAVMFLLVLLVIGVLIAMLMFVQRQ